MISGLNADYNSSPGRYFKEDLPRNWAVGGYTVANIKANIDTWLGSHFYHDFYENNIFLINLGVNDMLAMPDGTTWKSDYSYIIDALLTKYPGAKIFLTKSWMAGYDTLADTVAGYVDDLVAAYAVSNPDCVYVGDDERVWRKGGDNGATNGSPHNTAAGEIAQVVAVRARLLAVLGW